jgi:hypothetical protein
LSYTADENIKWCNQYTQYFGSFLISSIYLLYDPAIVLLGTYPDKSKYMSVQSIAHQKQKFYS